MAKRQKGLSKKDEEAISKLLVMLFVAFYCVCQKLFKNQLLSTLVVGAATFLLALSVVLLTLRAIKLNHIKRVNLLARDSLYRDYSPAEFERVTAELFRKVGYKARVTAGSGDRGIDVVLSKNGEKIGVQCKRYQENNKIGPSEIREFVGALEGARLSQGYFVTTSEYTRGAREAARDSRFRIKLVTGEKLGELKNRIENRANAEPSGWWDALSGLQKTMLVILLLSTVMMFSMMFLVITLPLTQNR